jgi:large subunit ribosomal protein L6
MSRVGLKPIPVPSGVTVTLSGNSVNVKGPKGEISRDLPAQVQYKQENGVVTVSRSSEDKTTRSMHGLARTLIANMVEGVTAGFSKELEIIGVGYKAEVKGKSLVLTVGYSHPVEFSIPDGIKVETASPTQIKISGVRKDLVGQVCADIRKVRPPEPYKGKGIKYIDEQIQRKAGKAAAGA